MTTYQFINEKSPHLQTVKSLWRKYSKTLGFMPSGAFDSYASERHILVMLNNSQTCVGYILYRIVRERVVIAHFCVDEASRTPGAVRGMLNALIENTQCCHKILLSCRRDFKASETWPRLGFHASGEKAGRAIDGSELVCWELDYGHADLFSDASTVALDIAIDANIFFDLVHQETEETEGLKADWLRPLISLCYTAELLNEINRHENKETRKDRKTQIQQFKLLRCTPEEYQEAEQTLRPLFSTLARTQDESDYRHLVRAHAAGADAFATRDEKLLDRADEVFEACGLPVVRPAELIGRIDIIEREREYQRSFVAGTRRITQERISCVDDDLVMAIRHPAEKKRSVKSHLNTCLADPQRIRCCRVAVVDGGTLAAFVVKSEGNIDDVSLLRVCATRLAGSIARSVLIGLIRKAIRDQRRAILISDGSLSAVVKAACDDLGFLPVTAGRVKLVVLGWHAIDDLSPLITWRDPKIDEVLAALPAAKRDVVTASRVEHLLWPGKLADSALPSFIVPIKPQFAEHLFDERLAEGGLFGAEVDLALNPESAYYRAAKPSVVTAPSRVLWYVSESDVYSGTKSIRACSRIVELAIDTPKRLFSRFRRLGVYEWQHVYETAKGDDARKIMAFRFDDSELMPPVSWETFQSILKAHDVKTNLQSPVQIPPRVFGEIYAAAFDTPKLRGYDSVGRKAV